MTRIVDNESLEMKSALIDALSNSKKLDASVGYFNVRGWNQLSKGLENLRSHNQPGSVRLLIGMAVPENQFQKKQIESASFANLEDEEIDIKIANQRANEAVQDFVEQLTWGIPDDHSAASIRSFLQDLRDGVVRVKFATRRRLHAKLYICHTDGGGGGYTSFVGSSNFTSSGLHGSGELNLEETDKQKGEELLAWFEERWEDGFSIDISERLIEVLENSWAALPNPSPRLIHLRIAYELSRDARSGIGFELPLSIAERLVPWQEAAVQVGSRILNNRGMVIVGDVVGLGKTIVGTAIAATSQERTVIICPKNLEDMWKKYIEVYELHAHVVPLSMATKVLPDLRHYGTVLVDESHNLRNTDTQAYTAVSNYIRENRSKVILLTATMLNASEADISGQLGLKLDSHEDLGIRPERYIESRTNEELVRFQEKVGGDVSSLRAFEESSFAEDWRRLLSLFMVRRTRPYLLENYAKSDENGVKYFEYRDGTKFHFPERKPIPLEYPGGPNDPCDRLVSLDNFEALEKMSYARYQLGKYFSDTFVASNEQEALIQEDLKRATASRGFIQTTVLKRLASSPKAFFITVEKMLLRAHVLRYAIENDLEIPLGSILDKHYKTEEADEAFDIENGPEPEIADSDGSWAKDVEIPEWDNRAKLAYESLLSNLPKDMRLIRSSAFEKGSLLEDLNKDNETLQKIINEHGAWNPENDSKLNKLEDLIRSLDGDSKLLVFSEYADSIDYLEKHLRKRLPGVKIGTASGRISDPTRVSRSFSPKSNQELGGLPEGEEELQVLLATDVLSEGQNLQDSAKILNWDLPWTIIKIIQRAGRVDRVGQKAKTISVYSFKPHDGIEDYLMLLKRLKTRLELNQEILGGGETIFSDHIEDNVEDFFTGKAALVGGEGDVDYASQALGIWNKATEEEKHDALSLGLGSHSTVSNHVESSSVLAYAQAKKGEDQIFDLFGLRHENGDIRTLTQIEALKITETTEQVSSDDLPEHNKLVSELVKKTLYPQAAQKPLNIQIGPRKKLLNFFDAAISELELDHPLKIAANELHTQTSDYALLDSGTRLVNQLLAKKSKGFLTNEDVLTELLEKNKEGLLLDTENRGLKSFDLIVSMGFRG